MSRWKIAGLCLVAFLVGGFAATASQEQKIKAAVEADRLARAGDRAAAPSVIFDASGERSPVGQKVLDDCATAHRMAHAENLTCIQQGFGEAALNSGLEGHSFYDRIREECAGDEACMIERAGAFHVIRTMSPTIPGPRL